MNEQQAVSMVGKILAIFWEPSRTFKALKVNTAWLDVLIPLILMMAVTLAAVPQITPIALQEQKARIENSERLSDEQKAAFLSSIEQRSLSITQYVSIILVTVLKLILVAGVLHMIANFIFGGESRFIQLLALSAYGQLVDVVSLAIKTPLIVLQNSTKIYTSPALFFTEESTFWFRFAASLDIFGLWKVVLFGIGIGIFSKVRSRTAGLVVGVTWVLYALTIAVLGGLYKV